MLNRYPTERQIQRFNLVVFYRTANGGNWFHNDNWLSYDVSECQWFSSAPSEEPICDEDDNFITLNLTSNNLSGTFTLTNTFIPSLVIFDVSNNDLDGRVPTAVSSPNLEVLAVSDNRFEGQLVGDGVFAAFKLRVIKIDGNQIVGSSASYVYRFLPHLEILNVTSNLFHGEFNGELRHCPNMTYIGFGHNDICGSIPTEMGVLTHLQELDVSGNPRMQGNIPEELSTLNYLTKLDVSGTRIAGGVPEPICERIEDNLMTLIANCSFVECCM
ncbi:STYKc [Seminavis robusta]|uniref:STYKc n=1 Tax=Seminavis robusta TaxID=568900 RepID=A0A9N8DM48_9STRA|nr:STYKc [Seminavis robusta]|eukprot:Sro160_g072160.1 STYKc (272) ;mRNA; f:49763-50578